MLNQGNAGNRLFVFLSYLMVASLFVLFRAPAMAADNFNYFASLQERLIDDGFDKVVIRQIYSRPEVTFETKGISLYFVHHESKVNYEQYTDKLLIKRAKVYMKKYEGELTDAKRTFGVEPDIITAIILIESQFGKLLGNRSIINTLSTMASLFDPEVREFLWQKISNTPELDRATFEEKADGKAKWAYRELKAFLNHVNREGYDPIGINGSFAGAMGISQFMPSNIPELAKDGNGDGRIDLFNHADAIASIAYFLKRHGWRPGIDRAKAEKVIHHYNHSERYVTAVLKISELLKGSKWI
jgi:membrane-bound lytic murein transglycosylase B